MNEDNAELASEHVDLLDASREDAERLIGVWLRRDVHGPVTYEPISAHDIRRWSQFAVGDDNPLYTDQGYGSRSPFGSMVAPPSFLYSIDTTIVAPGPRGIRWILRRQHLGVLPAGPRR